MLDRTSNPAVESAETSLTHEIRIHLQMRMAIGTPRPARVRSHTPGICYQERSSRRYLRGTAQGIGAEPESDGHAMRILEFILYFVALATVGSYIDYRIGDWLERRRCVKQLNEAIRGWRRP